VASHDLTEPGDQHTYSPSDFIEDVMSACALESVPVDSDLLNEMVS
jgi:hypothetical protein